MNINVRCAQKNLRQVTDEQQTQSAETLLLTSTVQALIGLAEMQQTANKIALASLIFQTTGEQPKETVFRQLERETNH